MDEKHKIKTINKIKKGGTSKVIFFKYYVYKFIKQINKEKIMVRFDKTKEQVILDFKKICGSYGITIPKIIFNNCEMIVGMEIYTEMTIYEDNSIMFEIFTDQKTVEEVKKNIKNI